MWPAQRHALLLERARYRALTKEQRRWCQEVWGQGWAADGVDPKLVKLRKAVCKEAWTTDPATFSPPRDTLSSTPPQAASSIRASEPSYDAKERRARSPSPPPDSDSEEEEPLSKRRKGSEERMERMQLKRGKRRSERAPSRPPEAGARAPASDSEDDSPLRANLAKRRKRLSPSGSEPPPKRAGGALAPLHPDGANSSAPASHPVDPAPTIATFSVTVSNRSGNAFISIASGNAEPHVVDMTKLLCKALGIKYSRRYNMKQGEILVQIEPKDVNGEFVRRLFERVIASDEEVSMEQEDVTPKQKTYLVRISKEERPAGGAGAVDATDAGPLVHELD